MLLLLPLLSECCCCCCCQKAAAACVAAAAAADDLAAAVDRADTAMHDVSAALHVMTLLLSATFLPLQSTCHALIRSELLSV